MPTLYGIPSSAALAVRVLPSGRKTWLCIYRANGRPRWLQIAAADAVGLADARRLAAGVMLRVAQGQNPTAERRAGHETFPFFIKLQSAALNFFQFVTEQSSR